MMSENGTARLPAPDLGADHIDLWSQGGRTNAANCQMLCREDNRRKSAI